MAMANMNLIDVSVTKLCPVQAAAAAEAAAAAQPKHNTPEIFQFRRYNYRLYGLVVEAVDTLI